MIPGLYLSGIIYESVADGPGVRTTIFVSGCKHNCPECQSPMTHNFTAGREVTDELIEEMNHEILIRKFLSGITLSGGDPFYSASRVVELLDNMHIPCNNVWAYTGFTFEEITAAPEMRRLLERVDVLVDGKYIAEQRDITLKFRGSSNQRLVNVKDSLNDPDGKIHII